MWQFYLGMALFGGLHLFSTLLPGRRDDLKLRMGERAYKMTYSVLSVIGIVFLVLAYRGGSMGSGALDPVYEPWHAGRHFILLMVLVGFILIFSSGSKGYIRKLVKHPFSLGIAVWALAHLLANGEYAVVMIFGMLLVMALADIIFSMARRKVPQHQPNWKHDLRSVAIGLILYAVFAFGFHPYILQVPVVS